MERSDLAELGHNHKTAFFEIKKDSRFKLWTKKKITKRIKLIANQQSVTTRKNNRFNKG